MVVAVEHNFHVATNFAKSPLLWEKSIDKNLSGRGSDNDNHNNKIQYVKTADSVNILYDVTSCGRKIYRSTNEIY